MEGWLGAEKNRGILGLPRDQIFNGIGPAPLRNREQFHFSNLHATAIRRGLGRSDNPSIVPVWLWIIEKEFLRLESAWIGRARAEDGRPRRNVCDFRDQLPGPPG